MGKPLSLSYIENYESAVAVIYQQIVLARADLEKISEQQEKDKIIENFEDNLRKTVEKYFKTQKQENIPDGNRIFSIAHNIVQFFIRDNYNSHPRTILLVFNNFLEKKPIIHSKIPDLYNYFDPLYILSKTKTDLFGFDIIEKFNKSVTEFGKCKSELEKSNILYQLYDFCEKKLNDKKVQDYYSHKTLKRTLQQFLKEFRKNLCQKALKENDPIAQNLLGYVILKKLGDTNEYSPTREYFKDFYNLYKKYHTDYLVSLNFDDSKNYEFNKKKWKESRKLLNNINAALSEIDPDIFNQYSNYNDFNYFKENYYLSNATFYLGKYHFECLEGKHSTQNREAIGKAIKTIFVEIQAPKKKKEEVSNSQKFNPLSVDKLMNEVKNGITALSTRDKQEGTFFYSNHRNSGLHKAFKKTGKSIASHSYFFDDNKFEKTQQGPTKLIDGIQKEDLVSHFYRFLNDSNLTWLTKFQEWLNLFLNTVENITEQSTTPRKKQ